MRDAPDDPPLPWLPRPPRPPDRTALLAGAAAIRSPACIRVDVLRTPALEPPRTATTAATPTRAPTQAPLPAARPATTDGDARFPRPTTPAPAVALRRSAAARQNPPPWPPAAPRPNGRPALLAGAAWPPIPTSFGSPSPEDRISAKTPIAAQAPPNRGPSPDTPQALPSPTSEPVPDASAERATPPAGDRTDDGPRPTAAQKTPSGTPPPARTDDGAPIPTGSPPPSTDEAADPGRPTEDPPPATEPSRPLLASTQHLLAQIADEIAALEARVETAGAEAAQIRAEAEQHRILSDSLLHHAERERDQARADADRLAQERQTLLARVETLEQALAQQRSSAKPPLPLPFPTNWQEVLDWCDAAFPGRIAFTKHTRQLIRSANPGDLYDDIPRAVFLLAWMAGPLRDDLLNNVPIGEGGPIEGHPGFHNVLTGSDELVQEYAYEGRRLRAKWHVKNGNGVRDQRLMLRIYYTWLPDRRLVVICRAPRHVKNAIS